VDEGRARALAARAPGCRATADWRAVAGAPDVDLVIAATPHDLLPAVALAAVEAGQHVLVEKPAARAAAELAPVAEAAARRGALVRVGFNHRYHRAFRKLRALLDEGVAGPLLFLRARYGHGGRIGYEKEWRADARISGGGELIDQGVHLIDLARWLLGDLPHVQGLARTFFWDMQVDDNAFLTLRADGGQVAFLHASATEWKNTFSLELYGRDAKLQVDGLGGSYGTERLTLYRMLPEMGPPETTAWEFPMADDSWAAEMAEFLEDVRLGRPPSASLADAIAALRVVEEVYRQSGPLRPGGR
jgi:predicted dehydrogenase